MSSSETAGKPIICRAAVAWGPNKPLSIEEVEVDTPKAGEVRIKLHYTGICHTDLFALSGRDPGIKFPIVLGHEASGVVESVGPGVQSVQPGDHVIPSPVPQCRKCQFCRSEKTNLCEQFPFGPDAKCLYTMEDGTTRFKCRGQAVHHFFGCSSFSQYIVASESFVCKINPAAPLDKVVVLGCGLTTGYGAPLNVQPVEAGSNVGIWGLGAIGLGVMLGCLDRGAKHIVAVDPDPKRLELAKEFGATELLHPDKKYEGKSVPDYLHAKYNGGLDHAFEAAGNHLAMQQAFVSTRQSFGQTCVLGVTEQSMAIPAPLLLMGRTVRGAIYGGWKSRDALPKLVQKYMDGQLKGLDKFISWRFDSLADINQGIEKMEHCDGIRSVIKLTSDDKNGLINK